MKKLFKVGDKVIFDGISAMCTKNGKVTFQEIEMIESLEFMKKYKDKVGTIIKIYGEVINVEGRPEYYPGAIYFVDVQFEDNERVYHCMHSRLKEK